MLCVTHQAIGHILARFQRYHRPPFYFDFLAKKPHVLLVTVRCEPKGNSLHLEFRRLALPGGMSYSSHLTARRIQSAHQKACDFKSQVKIFIAKGGGEAPFLQTSEEVRCGWVGKELKKWRTPQASGAVPLAYLAQEQSKESKMPFTTAHASYPTATLH